jgi:hypothetical protein
MDPFVRKMIFGGVAFLGAMLLMAGTLSAIYFHNNPDFKEAVIAQSDSPDGRWKAVVMEDRHDDASPLYFHINLSAAEEPIPVTYFGHNAEGEVFRIEEETEKPDPVLEWASPDQLTIHCPRCRASLVKKRDQHWGPITLRYELQP